MLIPVKAKQLYKYLMIAVFWEPPLPFFKAFAQSWSVVSVVLPFTSSSALPTKHTHTYTHMHTHMHTHEWEPRCRFYTCIFIFPCSGPEQKQVILEQCLTSAIGFRCCGMAGRLSGRVAYYHCKEYHVCGCTSAHFCLVVLWIFTFKKSCLPGTQLNLMRNQYLLSPLDQK